MINRYFRSGAPPVINPLYTRFPRDTVIPGSFAVTLTWTLPNRTTGAFNVTSPLPGDWFLAAHLPKDEGKISVKVILNHLWPLRSVVSCYNLNPSVVIHCSQHCRFYTALTQQTFWPIIAGKAQVKNILIMAQFRPYKPCQWPGTISGHFYLNRKQLFLMF